jgi:hypothetical protein
MLYDKKKKKKKKTVNGPVHTFPAVCGLSIYIRGNRMNGVALTIHVIHTMRIWGDPKVQPKF